MRSNITSLVFVLLSACALEQEESIVLDAPAGKADGASKAEFSISPKHPSQKIEIQCSEWFSCDLRFHAAYALDDVRALGRQTGVVVGVDVLIAKDGELVWDGAVMAVVNRENPGTPYTNGLADVVGEEDDEPREALTDILSLSGGKTSVFEFEFVLNDIGRQRLEWGAHPDYTITANARWW